ncbi:hypothetical protein KCP69_13960 [Salmonella enterica subsp. enterica]|nr:hypothetical protein KCP69_13960 [Salmonella enterica subsp. enterica]
MAAVCYTGSWMCPAIIAGSNPVYSTALAALASAHWKQRTLPHPAFTTLRGYGSDWQSEGLSARVSIWLVRQVGVRVGAFVGGWRLCIQRHQ